MTKCFVHGSQHISKLLEMLIVVRDEGAALLEGCDDPFSLYKTFA
jgi:hypothetical protein